MESASIMEIKASIYLFYGRSISWKCKLLIEQLAVILHQLQRIQQQIFVQQLKNIPMLHLRKKKKDDLF